MSDRPNALTCIVGAAVLLLAFNLMVVGGDATILWLDVKDGQIHRAAPGEAGTPWAGPLPTPTRWCQTGSAGQCDTATSPWYCPPGTLGRGEWVVSLPCAAPPLVACERETSPREQGGYICTEGHDGVAGWQGSWRGEVRP